LLERLGQMPGIAQTGCLSPQAKSPVHRPNRLPESPGEKSGPAPHVLRLCGRRRRHRPVAE
jgi:hypothetical protein